MESCLNEKNFCWKQCGPWLKQLEEAREVFLNQMQCTCSGHSQHDCGIIQRCVIVKKAIMSLRLIKNLLSATGRSIGIIVGGTVRLCLDYL